MAGQHSQHLAKSERFQQGSGKSRSRIPLGLLVPACGMRSWSRLASVLGSAWGNLMRLRGSQR